MPGTHFLVADVAKLSMHNTFNPSWAALTAAAQPEEPDPIMRTSYFSLGWGMALNI